MKVEGVLSLNESIDPSGGAEILLRTLTDSLRREGINMGILLGKTLRHDDSQPPDYLFPEINTTQTDDDAVKTFNKVIELMTNRGYNLVHIHSIANHKLETLLSLSKPTVKTIHDTRSVCPAEFKIKNDGTLCTEPVSPACIQCMKELGINDERARKKLDNTSAGLEAIQHAALVFAPSNYIKHELTRNGIDEDKIVIISPYLPNEKPHNDEQLPPYTQSDILYVGRVVKSKGVDQLIDAVEKIDDYTLTIVGDGNYMDEAQKRVSDKGLTDRVKFAGWIPNDKAYQYYLNTQVVVIPSVGAESFCMVGLEAMRCSKPVIAFDTGGINEWLDNKKNGILIQRGDIDSMANAIKFLLENPSESARLGRNGKQIFEERFQESNHINALFQAYNKAIQSFI